MIGDVGMRIGPRALKPLNSIEKIQPRITVSAQQSSPSTAQPMLGKKLTSSPFMMSYPPLYVASQNTTFVSLMETWMSKLVNHKFSLYNSSNRNGQHVTDFTIENRLTCLNTNFQKRKRKLWTYTYANNTKAQIDFVFTNKKWNNSILNNKAYFPFEGVSSDHRIIKAKIRLSLRRNTTRTRTTVHYD